MAPRMVMAADSALTMASKDRTMPPNAPSGSPPSLPLPATQSRLASLAAKSSDAALDAAAAVGWCEVAGAPADGPGLPFGENDSRKEMARAADTDRGSLVTCGLWLSRRRLLAAVLGLRNGERRVFRLVRTDDARFGLIEYLAAVGAELVATEALGRVDLTPMEAARHGLSVWTAGDTLVAALLGVAGIRDSKRAAALLARLPVTPLLRGSLRRLGGSEADPRQLPLPRLTR